KVPAAQLSLAEALVLSRCRWQVEVLCKLWKSPGQIDESVSGQPYRVWGEVDGKRLAMVGQHGGTLLSWGEAVGRRGGKAARKVRQPALHLASVRRVRPQLRQVLRVWKRGLQHGLKINKRKRQPALFQLLLAPPQEPPQQRMKVPA